ncbi:hypothetical protein [Haloterrigena sp. H1]|uniref:hypothetical protein n=1 Tax=Haloterrigena sp. H1 TaxID=2552943 RepID=UPI001BB2ADBA|nr:hypothetical protein [Haloterrigena sp. H1]
MDQRRDQLFDAAEWYFFSGGPGAPRYGDDPTKHAVDHDAEAFVREVLQNANDQGLSNGDPVEVTFRFITLTGDEKDEFLDALGWGDDLNHRLESIAHSDQGRGYDRVLERMHNPEAELRLLVVEDRNTTGLSGAWEEDSNYAALVRDELYSSKQEDTAGGSYGSGNPFSGRSQEHQQSYLIRISTTARRQTSRHDSSPGQSSLLTKSGVIIQLIREPDGSVTRPRRRMDHGRNRSGVMKQPDLPTDCTLIALRPAEQAPWSLNSEIRHGTTAPIDELAQEFVEASVKYFWPAIYRGDLKVTVETAEETLKADVNSVPAIRPFVECYAQRFTDSESLDDPGDVAGLDIPVRLPPRADGTETPDGSVRLATRLASPADDDTYLNTIALFRGPEWS